ncbi:hypothetical protein ABW19_dt0207527 [Dactylella cylindrospora]|nr:hypothetical protein ABW19_dt0207527 [Dactylella cylindrospora]
MFKGGWFSRSTTTLTSKGSSISLSGLDEQADLIAVLRAMNHVMDDNLVTAEAELEIGASVWHKLGMGAIGFIRSAAGFEQDVMKEASASLAAAETAAYNAQRTATRSPHSVSSYPAGIEFALANAEAQLMSAVIGVLSESIMEAMKAFYKMRNAFKTLEGVHKTIQEVKEKKRKEAEAAGSGNATSSNSNSLAIPSATAPGELANIDFPNPVDQYIESGGSLCYGTLMLFIGLIPPAMTRLLSVLGFHGDRRKGIENLWVAADMHDAHGALAALILLTYYSNIMQFCDIVETDEEKGGMPVKRCEDMLFAYRNKYPNSPIWILEEARLNASRKNLEAAVKLLEFDRKPQMKQIEAICCFEKALDSMYLHRYEYAADLFQQMKELNSWSDAMYLYIAGSCYLELYRETASEDRAKADEYANKAEELLLQVASYLGKKKFMARALPLEVFADGKVKKWQKFAKLRNCRLVDAVGVSPVEEMIYMWNGFKRMDKDLLNHSAKVLDWQPPAEEAENPKSCITEMDEQVLLAFLRGVSARNQGELEKSREILEKQVLSVDKNLMKGPDREDWVVPSAHYEIAVTIWLQSGLKEVTLIRDYLTKCTQWEAYGLDNRLGLRANTALDVLKHAEDGD